MLNSAPPLFINRLKEINLIRDKLNILKKKKYLFSFIVTILGIPGIGKTTLLKQAKQEAETLDIETIWIDCENGAAKGNSIYILQKIADAFFRSATSWQKALKFYRESQEGSRHRANLEPIVWAFVDNFKICLEETPVVLLIDNSYRLDEAGQKVLEEVLKHLYPSNQLLIILAGRADIRWRSSELRRRTQAITLDSFPKKEFINLLPNPDYASLTDQVYAVTRGYPLASVKAYEWVLDHLQPSADDLSDHFKAREAELIFDLFHQIFEMYILGGIDNPETRYTLSRLLSYISPLRRFDDNLLAALLREIDPQNFEHTNTLDARSYTRLMAARTYMVKWDSAKQAYALDDPIRQLLSLEMKFRDTDRLMQIHQFTLNWYQDAIDKVTAKDSSAPQSVIYLLEFIFHLVHLRQLQGQLSQIEAEIKQKLIKLFSEYYMRERIHFQEEFNRDQNLPELLGEIYNRLTEFVAHQVEFGKQ